jgi:phage terminase small subunit
LEKNRKGLTPAQRNFADEWLTDHNGTRAYIAAYPRVKKNETAKAAASRLLTCVNVAAYIQAKQAEISAMYNVTHQRTLREESYIAFANIGEAFRDGVLLAPDKLPETLQPAVRNFEIIDQADGSRKFKYRFWDKGKALERLSRYLGLFQKDDKQKSITLVELFSSLAAINPKLAEAVRKKMRERVMG